MILRIAGPAVVFALNKLEALPAKSKIYINLDQNFWETFFSLNQYINLYLLRKNFVKFKLRHFFIQIDGIAIKDSIRWCSYNNEITAACYGCRLNKSSYLFNYSSN